GSRLCAAVAAPTGRDVKHAVTLVEGVAPSLLTTEGATDALRVAGLTLQLRRAAGGVPNPQ
ncbi:hypothetical protein BD309DRAFT_848813, partial [Dichomitus squalens]